MAELHIVENPEKLAETFAEELLQQVSRAAGNFHLALSGGSTPRLLFDLLARDYAARMPWAKIHFWWGDERCVSPAHPDSNYKMAYEHLLSQVPVHPTQIHRVKGELDPEEASKQYAGEICDQVPAQQGLPSFDLVMLGIGDDGHTASIFPDRMDLPNSAGICQVATHPQSGQKRVSLTGPVLNNARHVCFLVSGKSKAGRIGQIVNQESAAAALPASYIRPVHGRLSFFLDQDAASGIKKQFS